MSRPDKPTILQRLIGVSGDFFNFILDSFQEDLVRESVLADLGLDPKQKVEPQLKKEQLDGVRAYSQSADPDFEAYRSAAQDIIVLLDAFTTFVETVAKHNDVTVDDILHPLFDLMVLNYVRLRMPIFYWVGQPLGFVEGTLSKHSAARFYTKKGGRVFIDFLKRLCGLVSNPTGTIRDIARDFLDKDSILPQTEEDARLLSFFTLYPIAVGSSFFLTGRLNLTNIENADFLNKSSIEVGTNTLLGLDLPADSPTPLADRISQRTLSFGIVGTHTDAETGNQFEGSILTTLLWIPEDHGGPGFYVGLGGAEEVAGKLNRDWAYKVKLGSDQAFAVLLKKPPAILGPADAKATLTIERTDAPDEAIVFPQRSGTRFEFGRFAISGEISSRGAGASITATNAALVFANRDGDGFIGSVMPDGETRLDFDLGLGVDTQRGLYIDGGSGTQAVFPVGRSLGPLNIQTIMLGVGAIPDSEDGAARIELSSAFSVKLGAFTASVDRLGLRVDVDFPESEGNKGFPNLEFGVKPPNGIGLVVDSESITGGGYLYFDPDNARYAGIVQLRYEGIAFKAVGLISTKLEDDSRGFSLLLIASAEGFKAIPLGYGFQLIGAGGLIGYNRTAKIDVLRSGLKNRTLDSILFPDNPVRDAPRIISNLRSVFPARRNQFLFGPIGLIEWGAKKIVTIDLGIILELPSPTRLVLLGQLQSRFPTKEKPLVRINLDVLGEINFSEATISLDASLYDSRLLSFVLTGDAALRMRFRSDPLFVLSIGGLHPNFPTPQNLPRLEHITISLSQKENPRLRLEAYLAITSATYQYGARLDLYLRAAGFSVEGFLSFDALLDWSTGQFEASFGAAVTLKWHGRTLLGVYLDVTLSGPSNSHIRGKAVFKIWRFSKTKHFDEPLGNEPLPPVSTADPLPELVAALADQRNWAGQIAASGSTLVSLRELPGENTVLVHPLGELVVRQQVVPLNTEISRIGGARPSNDRRFTIDSVMLGSERVENTPTVRDHFAAGQFIDMTDDERLVRPSFELMDSGLSLGSAGVSFGGQSDADHMVETPVEYETVIVGAQSGPVRSITSVVLSAAQLKAIAHAGAVGRSAARRTGTAKYRVAQAKPVVPKKHYALANTATVQALSTQDMEGAVSGLTYTQAVEAQNRYLLRHPDRRDLIQIVPERELVGVAP